MTTFRIIALSAFAAFVIAVGDRPGRLVRHARLRRRDRQDQGPRPARELREVRGDPVGDRRRDLRLLSQRRRLRRVGNFRDRRAGSQGILNARRVDWRYRWGPPMSAITREFAESFFNALSSREPARIAPFVADDADWLIVGPIELFPYCGQHYGKEAVLAGLWPHGAGQHHRALRARLPDDRRRERLRAHPADRRAARDRPGDDLRLAQFARFRDGKVCEFCSIIDTLGVAEQVIGRPLIALPTRRRSPSSWRNPCHSGLCYDRPHAPIPDLHCSHRACRRCRG